MSEKYILAEDGKTPVQCDDLMQWAHWMEDNRDLRKIAFTKVPGGRVSTVFLGLDHNFSDGEAPILFESMHFADGSWADLACDRYSTYEEAIAGHWRMVEEVSANKTVVDRMWYKLLDWLKS